MGHSGFSFTGIHCCQQVAEVTDYSVFEEAVLQDCSGAGNGIYMVQLRIGKHYIPGFRGKFLTVSGEKNAGLCECLFQGSRKVAELIL